MFNLYGPINARYYSATDRDEYILHHVPSNRALYTFISNLPLHYEELLNTATGWSYSPASTPHKYPLYLTFSTPDDIPELFI